MKAFELLYGLTEAEISEVGIDPRSGPGGDWMANKNAGPAPGGMMPFSRPPMPTPAAPTPGTGPSSSATPPAAGNMQTASDWTNNPAMTPGSIPGFAGSRAGAGPISPGGMPSMGGTGGMGSGPSAVPMTPQEPKTA